MTGCNQTAFKALIVAHIMIREGAKDVTLQHLAMAHRSLAVSHLSGMICICAISYIYVGLLTLEIVDQGHNIHQYGLYLDERVVAFRDLEFDHARYTPSKESQRRLRSLSIEKGLLREVECVQSEIRMLLKCKVSL